MIRLGLLLFVTAVVVEPLAGCQINSRDQVLAVDRTQVQLRSVSTRAFDTADLKLTVRNVIATLQDLNFVIDKADEALGTVSATKFDTYVLRMTVTVRPHGERQVAVRASAQYNMVAVSDAKPYQQFFNALEKAMFLTANNVD
jgi:hypothetical protein